MNKYDTFEKYTTGVGQNVWVHRKDQCCDTGNGCPIHSVADILPHKQPTHWRQDRGIMEVICDCGIGHPHGNDPTRDRVHGCCGIKDHCPDLHMYNQEEKV